MVGDKYISKSKTIGLRKNEKSLERIGLEYEPDLNSKQSYW